MPGADPHAPGTTAGDRSRTPRLAARGVQVVEGEVVGIEVTDERLVGVRLASGLQAGAMSNADLVTEETRALDAAARAAG